MNKRGSLAITMMVVVLILTLAAALCVTSVNETALVRIQANSMQSFWLAEAGAQKGLWEYKNNSCRGFVQQGTNTACSDCSCNGANKTLAATLSGNGDYDVVLNSTNTTLTSIGSAPSRTASNKVLRRVQATLSPTGLFNGALFAKNTIQLSNSVTTNSYNSTVGTYNVNGNIGTSGHVGTNATNSGAITMSNSTVINGNASTGPGGSIVQNNSATITGAKTYTNNVSLPNVVVPASLTSLSLIGHINNSQSQTQTLNAGSYKYTGWTLSNNAVITINGDVNVYLTSSGQAVNLSNSTRIDINPNSSLTLYTDGTISLANTSSFNNLTANPSKLKIYSMSTSSNGFTLSNNTNFYGVVYMPNADIQLSNSVQFYGAMVGKSINLSNSTQVHYDQAVANLTNPFSSNSGNLTNWQEY